MVSHSTREVGDGSAPFDFFLFVVGNYLRSFCSLLFKEVQCRLRVREITLEIGDMFVLYSISPKPNKLSFETE